MILALIKLWSVCSCFHVFWRHWSITGGSSHQGCSFPSGCCWRLRRLYRSIPSSNWRSVSFVCPLSHLLFIFFVCPLSHLLFVCLPVCFSVFVSACFFGSVQSLDHFLFGGGGGMRNDSVEILFQCFLHEAILVIWSVIMLFGLYAVFWPVMLLSYL